MKLYSIFKDTQIILLEINKVVLLIGHKFIMIYYRDSEWPDYLNLNELIL